MDTKTNTQQFIRAFEMEPTPGSYFPENRLWCAIVLQAIADYECSLSRIVRKWSRTREALDAVFYYTTMEIRRECTHRWFAFVCEHAGVRVSDVLRRLTLLDETYCLRHIKFVGTDRALSERKIRGIRNRRRYQHVS